MKIISWNVNGLRACAKKGAVKELLDSEKPDLFFLQETKLQPEQALPFVDEFNAYNQTYHSAEKKGYSGVSAWVSEDFHGENLQIETGMNGWNDSEGRVIAARFNRGDEKFLVIVCYFPNGGKSPEAWEEKLAFYDHFLQRINSERENGYQVIWGGDVNTAHTEIDLARPKQNDGKVGFHPLERAWLDRCIADNWQDVFRNKNPEAVEKYTWWSYRGGNRERNVGWRIDYLFCDISLMERVKRIEHLTHQTGSDHCSIVLEI